MRWLAGGQRSRAAWPGGGHGAGQGEFLKRLSKSVDLDRIERIYLASLRVAILGVATLCLLGALIFGGNALWRVFVSTEVEQAPVEVTGTEIAAELKKAAPQRGVQEGGDDIAPAVRRAHALWASEAFPKYYAIYRKAADAYKKPEDETLNSQQLMSALGYDLQSYAESNKAKLFINNAEYQQQALTAVATALSDAAVVGQLTEYKAAEKTAKSCSTTYQRQRVWDSYSTACYAWYAYPQGCEVTRSVPVQRCVPAYPEGIVSPRVAFGRADEEFFRLWTERSAQVSAEAQATRDGREAIRAQIGPNLLLALQILGAFLVVMFFFLMVAIERHLRGGRFVSNDGPPTKTDEMDIDPSVPSNPSVDASEVLDETPAWARRR